MAAKRIVFHVGGPRFHPVDEQATIIAQWLGEGFACEQVDGVAAFERLAGADLLVVMGLHWPDMSAEWAGKMTYTPMRPADVMALRAYAASGRPIVSHHGGVASYPETPEFAEACGWAWVWGETTHSPFGRWEMTTTGAAHPVTAGVGAYSIEDEIYYRLRVMEPARTAVHATAEFEGAAHPMVSTREAGGGVGRRLFLANGHDMRAMECPAMKRFWTQGVRWALGMEQR